MKWIKFKRAIKLDNLQRIDFTSQKNSRRCFLSATTHVFYKKALEFKNLISVSDKYLVGETGS